MTAYENDVFVIPDALKIMSVSELEREKQRMLAELKKQKVEKKPIKPNKSGITFNF